MIIAASRSPASLRKSVSIRVWAASCRENDFAGYMENLELAHPKKIDIAVPANLALRARWTEHDLHPARPDWAPLNINFGGIWEMQPEWLEETPAPTFRFWMCASATNSPGLWAAFRARF